MEDTTWDQRVHAITHILTSPTTAPPLHSQFFISTQIPSYLNWDYPPQSSISDRPNSLPLPIPFHLRWAFFHIFLDRVSRFGLPLTSWRSKCPYQQPPPLILAKGIEEAEWGDEERRAYVRNRLRRKKRLGVEVNTMIPVLLPNILLLSLLMWNPIPESER